MEKQHLVITQSSERNTGGNQDIIQRRLDADFDYPFGLKSVANNKHEAPLILTVHKPSMYRDHLLPTAFEGEEDLTDKKQYRLGYFGGKCQVKKPGGIRYTWG